MATKDGISNEFKTKRTQIRKQLFDEPTAD
jgi:hypothetical protein